MLHPFLQRLQQGPLLADGAMGTLLYSLGIAPERCLEELNRSDAELVQGTHRRYIEAGAQLIETNTFGANRYSLAPYGLATVVQALNYAGAKAAREAREVAGVPVFVGGSVGPLHHISERLSPEEMREAFREQVEGLLEGGVDLLALETFADLEEILVALETARSLCDLPVIALMTFDATGKTAQDLGPREVAQALTQAGAALVGANCSTGPEVVLHVMGEMVGATKAWLGAMPNAGLPTRHRGRLVYGFTPGAFATYGRSLLELGVRMIGGCCGTTPQHIQALRTVVEESVPEVADGPLVEIKPSLAALPQVEEREGPTLLAQRLKDGRFVISVELDPPKGLNPTKVLAGAAMLKEYGVDCINVGDSPMARVRMSGIATARLIREQTGLDVILHFTTRDRNLMALQADLLGAHALGIRNILALRGDPPKLGDYPTATGVWDVDSVGFIQIMKRLNEGFDSAGASIGHPASFFVGCATNPNNEDWEWETHRLRQKVEAGADFIMTQPVYEAEHLERFLAAVGPLPIPIILGVLPLQSHRHAEFLHHNVPGISVPLWMREEMRLAGDRGIRRGIELAQEFLMAVKGIVAGVYIMPSFGRYEVAAELVQATR